MSKHSKKPTIGVCGGIGAGKSQVAAEFASAGCLVINSDEQNRAVLHEAAVKEQLRKWWGAGVIGVDGEIDRQSVARIVFADLEQKRRLESLVHPLIDQRRRAMIRAVDNNPAIKAIVLDSPLLFESNLDRECDAIVYVEATEAARLQRLHANRGWSVDELQQRESWQMPLGEKRRRADFVVDNNGPVAQLRPQVLDILKKIVSRFECP